MAEQLPDVTFPPVSPELLAARGATLREVRADLVRQDSGYCGRFDEWEVLPASAHRESVTAEARLLLARVTTLPAQVLETLVRALDA